MMEYSGSYLQLTNRTLKLRGFGVCVVGGISVVGIRSGGNDVAHSGMLIRLVRYIHTNYLLKLKP